MKNRIFLILILVLAFVLRFWRLGNFPALNADEAAIGYNAYSLIQTGMDEHGNSWPIHFQSFNDYKPGLMFYLVLPFVKFMGLTVWAVRIPGALAGVGTVWIVYRLIVDGEFLITRKGKNQSSVTNHQSLGLIASLFLAISPWHIHFSRGGWEVNVATFFITTGVWMFIKSLRDSKYYIPSTIFFVLSLYTYHATRVVVPLLGLGLVIFYWSKLLADRKQVLVAGVIGFVILIPLFKDLAGPAGLSRAAGVGIFSDPGPINEINEQRGEHEDLTSISSKIIHNKPINYTLAFAQNYIEHFSGEFLFLSGDEIQRNKVPEHGQMYMLDALFVLVGTFALFKSKYGKIIGLWLLVAPVAAALTFQSPHALRAQNMVIPLTIMSAVGFISLLDWFGETFNNKNVYSVWCVVCGVLLLWGFARYQHLYWIHMPRAYPFSSQYGVEELMDYIKENQDKYENIVITDRYDQPYILTLFYLKYPPEKFQKDHILTAPDGYGFSTVRNFDNFKFNSIDWPETPNEYINSLIVGTDEEIPEASNIIETIQFPNGESAFEIVAN